MSNDNTIDEPSGFRDATCLTSFWDTPETDEAVANAECESDLVLSMRSMEKRMNDAIIEATNAVNDIIRITLERNRCKQALEKIVSNRGFEDRALQRMAEDALDSFSNTPAHDNQNAL
jgi:signal transduction protein with GAF and PtsI domain